MSLVYSIGVTTFIDEPMLDFKEFAASPGEGSENVLLLKSGL